MEVLTFCWCKSAKIILGKSFSYEKIDTTIIYHVQKYIHFRIFPHFPQEIC